MKKGLKKVGTALFGTPPSALELPGDANVNDEAEGAGVAFSALMSAVGGAVAKTQMAMNLAGAQMANLLSNTPVEVVVAEEEVYDDSGTLVGATSYKSTVPLISLVEQPVFYEWPSVRFQGIFVGQEFTAASATNVSQISATASVSAGRKARRSLSFRVDVAASNTNVTTSLASDTSFGRMRMNAMLSPRNDVVFPKPNIVTTGPRIGVFQGEIQTSADKKQRTIDLLIKYTKKANADGSQVGIAGKALSIETSGLDWEFVASDPAATNLGETNSDGEVNIRLVRSFAVGDADTNPPQPATVTVRKNLVSTSVTLKF